MDAEIEADDSDESTTTNLDDLDGFDTAEERDPYERGWTDLFGARKDIRMDPWLTTLWQTDDERYVLTKCNTDVSTNPRGGTFYDILQVGDEIEITEMHGVDSDNYGAREVANLALHGEEQVYEAIMKSGSEEAIVDIAVLSDGWPDDEWEAVNEEAEFDFRFEFSLK